VRSEALAAAAAAPDLRALDRRARGLPGQEGAAHRGAPRAGALSSEERPAVARSRTRSATRRPSRAIAARQAELSAAALDARVAAEAWIHAARAAARATGTNTSSIASSARSPTYSSGWAHRGGGPDVELDYYNFTALTLLPTTRAQRFRHLLRRGPVGRGRARHRRVRRAPAYADESGAGTGDGETKPPIYILAPGKVYRRDIADPSHSRSSHRFEGLAVDEGITFGDLKGTLERFCHEMFGPDRAVRLRPHFFPFTEPSAEVDVSCHLCAGAGCRFCKGTGWQEILGCGMVDPNVYGYVGIDPSGYSASPSGWEPSGSRPSSTACRTCATTLRATCASCASSRPGERDSGLGRAHTRSTGEESESMRVSMKWLRELVDVEQPVHELAELLEHDRHEGRGHTTRSARRWPVSSSVASSRRSGIRRREAVGDDRRRRRPRAAHHRLRRAELPGRR